MTSAISAQGVVLTRAGTAIAEIKTIGGPGESAATIDVTSHDSAGHYREFLAGFLDGGEITIEGNFLVGDTNGQIGLHTDLQARTVQSFVLTFPTAVTATYTFSGVVTAFKPNFPFDAEMSFSATIKVSGQPVLAIGASAGVTACVVTAAGGAKTAIPTFAVGTYDYVVNVLTGESYVTFTATFAAGTCTVHNSFTGVTTTLVSTVASAQLTIGAAGTVTTFTVVQTDPGEVAKTYVFHVARP